jgi:hypothetical protein
LILSIIPESRLREYVGKRWYGKGRHTGEVIEAALQDFWTKPLIDDYVEKLRSGMNSNNAC